MHLGLTTKWLDIFPWLAPLVGSGLGVENSARKNVPVTRSVAQRKEISVRDTSLYAAGLTTGFFWLRLVDATTAKSMSI